jgi:ribose 5-phosphate isomerase RpiB
MADMGTAIRGGDGIAFLVSAGIVYEIIAAACSSPQTMEINASARAGTLMKWVNIGVGQAALFIIIAAMVDRQHRAAIIAGGTTAGVLMYAQYSHAKRAGLASDAPGTESY